MKYLVYLFLMLQVPCLCFADSRTDEVFAGANNLYAKKDYRQAQTAYLNLINEGYLSVPLYFNMGNASYKTGDIASALLYYEKARRLSPGDEAIDFNIRLANSKTIDRADYAPEFFLTRWWHNFILSFSSGALAIVSILLFLTASASLIIYFFAESFAIKKYAFFSSIIIFLFGMLAVITANSQANYFERHKEAIVFAALVNVRSTPGLRSASISELHSGTKVAILKNKTEWWKIRLLNGHEGWVPAAALKAI